MYIVLFSIAACGLLYYVEQRLMVSYGVKTLSKLTLFILGPLFYIVKVKKTSLKSALNLGRKTGKSAKLGIILGILSFVILLMAYNVVGLFMDFGSIVGELKNVNVTAKNIIIIGLYITFGNSLLEEFFFRGFVFLNLYQLGFKKSGYFFSALLFSLYHIGIFKNWFEPWVMALALFGLISIGLIFNWLCTKTNNFINSWIVHILADSAIILIGFKLFGIL